MGLSEEDLSTLVLDQLYKRFKVGTGASVDEIDAAQADLECIRAWVATLKGWRQRHLRRAYRRWLSYYERKLRNARVLAIHGPSFPTPPPPTGCTP